MFDEGSGGAALQRVVGRAKVRLGPKGLKELYQSGSAKVLLPKTYGPAPEIVFLNTAGGVTSGDQLSYRLAMEAGTAIGTTQTAERAYRRADDRPAQVDIALEVGPEARLLWLPQETILFDRAGLSRRTHAEMSGGSELCLLDMFVFGRIAMGELVQRIDLKDKRSVWRDGRPVLLDPLRLASQDLNWPGMAGMNAAKSMAVLHVIAPDAEDRLNRVREVLPGDGSAAVSAWDGRLSFRMMHENPSETRKVLARVLPIVTGLPLPRVWPR